MGELEQAVCVRTNALLAGQSHIKLLEAGCGSSTHITFEPQVYAVGIDISREQLEKNVTVQERILGDLQEYPLPANEFDVAICWMVLEHLAEPQKALVNMFNAVKPGGLVILGFPNLFSIKGIVTKLTPFWFHEAFYRMMKYQFHPFPTYLRVAILPAKVVRFAEEQGFSVELVKLVEGGVVKKVRSRFRMLDVTFAAIDWVTKVISFGRMQSPLLDGCAIILKKRAGQERGSGSLRESCMAR